MGGDGVGPVVQQLNQFSHHGAACTEVMEGGIRPILSIFAGSHFQVASLTQTIRLITVYFTEGGGCTAHHLGGIHEVVASKSVT